MSPLRSHCTNSRQICPLNRSEEEEQWLRCEWSSELPGTKGGGGGASSISFRAPWHGEPPPSVAVGGRLPGPALTVPDGGRRSGQGEKMIKDELAFPPTPC